MQLLETCSRRKRKREREKRREGPCILQSLRENSFLSTPDAISRVGINRLAKGTSPLNSIPLRVRFVARGGSGRLWEIAEITMDHGIRLNYRSARSLTKEASFLLLHDHHVRIIEQYSLLVARWRFSKFHLFAINCFPFYSYFKFQTKYLDSFWIQVKKETKTKLFSRNWMAFLVQNCAFNKRYQNKKNFVKWIRIHKGKDSFLCVKLEYIYGNVKKYVSCHISTTNLEM